MNKKQLRIEIARDVLLQLRLKKYEAVTGTYVYVDGTLEFFDNGRASFKDGFKKDKDTTCDVCALGSCFISLVNIKNKCSIEEVADESKVYYLVFQRLKPIFGARNMDMMESAFERVFSDNADSDLPEHTLNAAAEWGEQWQDDNERLRQIMLNIIRNDGNFKLPKRFQARARALKKEENCCYW